MVKLDGVLENAFLVLFVGMTLLLTSCSNDAAQTEEPVLNSLTFEANTYGGSLNDNAMAIVSTDDGGYALLGHTQSNDGDIVDKENTSFDFWLMKFDALHALSWSRTYGGEGDDRGSDLVQLADGGYAILGYSTSDDGDVTENAGAQDYWVARTDASGAILWQRSFGFSGRDEGISIIETSDLGFLLVGTLDVTASQGEGRTLQRRRHAGGSYWALRIDANGNIVWRNFFGGTFTDTPQAVVEDSNGDFVIAGSSDSNDVDVTGNHGSYDMWAVKISNEGSLIWERSIGGSEIDQASDMIIADDGNLILVGDTRSSDINVDSNNGAADLWIVKIDPEGQLIWEHTYGGSGFDVGRAIVRIPGNGFYITGSSRSLDGDVANNQGQNDVWLIRVDEAGVLQDEITIGGSEIEFGHDLAILANGQVVVVGESGSSNGDVPQNKGFTDILRIVIQ